MNHLIDELTAAHTSLAQAAQASADPADSKFLAALEDAASQVGRSWSGSWLGYHSRVYYKGLRPPPPGAHFCVEWGFLSAISSGTHGDWVEYEYDAVVAEIYRRAGNPDLSHARELAEQADAALEHGRDQVVGILELAHATRADPFISRLLDDAKASAPVLFEDFLKLWQPRGQIASRDSTAVGQGIKVPPHLFVAAEALSLSSPGKVCAHLARVAQKASAHLERQARIQVRADRVGTNVLIGHGRSLLWKDVKDFVQDRLRLPWDEFNRVPVAGITNIARLSDMLDSAGIAFVIMTAEDEQADGAMRARMNVIHEVGLFQGRLGFTKAIVLIEEGCEEFSNIEGLGQIRFPRGDIRAAFEEIRLVLERENVIVAPS